MYDLLLIALMALAVLAPTAVGFVLGWCAHSVRRWQTGRRMARRITELGLEVAGLRSDRDALIAALVEADPNVSAPMLPGLEEPTGRHHRPGPSRIRQYVEPPEPPDAD